MRKRESQLRLGDLIVVIRADRVCFRLSRGIPSLMARDTHRRCVDLGCLVTLAATWAGVRSWQDASGKRLGSECGVCRGEIPWGNLGVRVSGSAGVKLVSSVEELTKLIA